MAGITDIYRRISYSYTTIPFIKISIPIPGRITPPSICALFDSFVPNDFPILSLPYR